MAIDRWEGLLSKILPYQFCLVTVVLEQLIPNSSPFVSQQIQLGMSLNREIKITVQRITSGLLLPIIESETEDPFTSERIKSFVFGCNKITAALRRIFHFTKLAELDLEIYHKVKAEIENSPYLDMNAKKNSLKVIDIMLDYYANIIPLIENRRDNLKEALKQINGDDFLKSLYGTSLAFVCITMILYVQRYYNNKRFINLANYGFELANKLSHYTVILYRLTNATKEEEISIIENLPKISQIEISENASDNEIAFEYFVREHLNDDQYRGKYVAFVHGEFQKAHPVRNQLVKEMYLKFGNVPMFVEKVSLKRREVLFDTLE